MSVAFNAQKKRPSELRKRVFATIETRLSSSQMDATHKSFGLPEIIQSVSDGLVAPFRRT